MTERVEELRSKKARLRLLIVLFSPLVMLFLSVNALYYYTAVKPLVEYERLTKKAEHLNEVLNFVKQLQRERGLSLADTDGKEKLREQRARVDLNFLKSLLGQKRVEELRNFREKVDNMEAGRPEIYQFYTSMIEEILGKIQIYYQYSINDVGIYRLMLSKLALIYLIEYAGRERALSVFCVLEAMENGGKLCPEDISRKYNEVLTLQSSYAYGLLRFLDEETKQKAEQELFSVSDEHTRLRQAIIFGLPLEGYRPMKVYDIVSERVEKLIDFYEWYNGVFQDYMTAHKKRAYINFLGITLASFPVVFILVWITLQFQKHYRDVVEMGIRDGLTGLYNSRFFWELLKVEVEKARRYGERFALIILDLDNFKPINDIHGHNTGDKVLREIAGVIRKRIRSSDFAARYGGDEFVIVLSKTDEDGALSFAKNLKAIIENIRISSNKGEVSPMVSIGIAIYPEHGRDHLELFSSADTALLKIKKHSKGSIQVFKPS